MMVTDQVVAAVVDVATSKLELRVPLTWTRRPTTSRAEAAVHNAHGLPLRSGLQVIIDKPWKVTAYLMLHGTQIRRLDVNGSHRNRTDGTGLAVPDPQARVLRGPPVRRGLHADRHPGRTVPGCL